MGASDTIGAKFYYTNMAKALGAGAQSSAAGAQSLGVLEDWIAPVGIFDAPAGFGEECWLDSGPVTVLASRLQGARVSWLCGPAAGRVSSSNSIALQPRGAPNFARADGPVRFAHTYLPDALIDRVADSIKPGAKASGMLRDDLVFMPDRELEMMTHAHVRAAISGASALELEASAILLIGTLLRRYHGFAEAKAARGGLAPWQIKRACEAMLAHLDEDISLDMLAAVADCSPSHFSRAFKQSTGLAPFQWLLERRIERAKELLADPGMSLAQVALSVGFSAQPQFTTAFRRLTGAPPGTWRRQQIF